MTFFEYIKNIGNVSKYSINFDQHFYLKLDKDNQDNYYRTLAIYKVTFFELLNFCLNLYNYKKIKGHEEIPPEIIEQGFVFYGGIGIFKDATGELGILPARPSSKLNKYGKSEKIILTGFNGFTLELEQVFKKEDFKNSTCVFIEDNTAGASTLDCIYEYTRRITDNTRALEVATQKLKQPFIFYANKEKVSNLKKFYQDLENNKPLIIQTDRLLENTTAELAQYNVATDSIKAIKEEILFNYAKFLELFGINTDPNPDKMERKLVDEVNSNNEFLNINKKVRQDKRDELIKKAKEICDITIEYKEKETEDETTKATETTIQTDTTDPDKKKVGKGSNTTRTDT